MRQFAAFILATLVWAAGARLLLETGLVHPLAVGVVWLVGFIWMTGYVAAGPRDADLLLKRWFQMMAGIVVLGGLGLLVFS